MAISSGGFAFSPSCGGSSAFLPSPTTTVAGAAKTGKICISLPFAGKLLHISFVNLTWHEYGSYGIFAVSCGNNAVAVTDSKSVVIPRSMLEQTDKDEISIILHIK